MTRINKFESWKNEYPEAMNTEHCYECNALVMSDNVIDNLCIDCARKEFMEMKKQLSSQRSFLNAACDVSWVK
jgi:hypothetical protein